jgi:hypothetical protein
MSSNYCKWIPSVHKQDGTEVGSKFFTDLLYRTNNNREIAGFVYSNYRNNKFPSDKISQMDKDEFNEPRIESFIRVLGIEKLFPVSELLAKYNKEIGAFKLNNEKGGFDVKQDTPENMKSLVRRAIAFNNSSDTERSRYYIAQVIHDRYTNQIHLEVRPRTVDSTNEEYSLEYNYTLNDKLKELLINNGVSIGVLENLEKSKEFNGIADFRKAHKNVLGLMELVRLANGEKGQQALPEEFAHVVVAALYATPEVRRLFNYVKQNNLAKEIIGDEWDKLEKEYSNELSGDALDDKMVNEALGKLVAKHLLGLKDIKYNAEEKHLGFKARIKFAIQAIKDFINKHFTKTTLNKLLVEADRESLALAKEMLYGEKAFDVSKIDTSLSSYYYQTEQRVSRMADTLKKLTDEIEKKRYFLYRSRGTFIKNKNSQISKEKQKEFATQQKSYIKSLEFLYKHRRYAEGVNGFVLNGLHVMKELNDKLRKINELDSMQEKFWLLKNISNYISSYRSTVQDLSALMLNEDLTLPLNQTLKQNIDAFRILIDDLDSNFGIIAKPMFIKFLEPWLGKEIVIPFGRNKGKVIKASQFVDYVEHDISMFDRWLYCMAESPAFVLKVYDNIAKTKHEDGRLDGLDYRKKLEALGKKLEKAGVKDFKWMFEYDEDGHRTGKYISKYDYRTYYKEYNKFKEKTFEKYKDENPLFKGRYIESDLNTWKDEHRIYDKDDRRIWTPIFENKEYAELFNATDAQSVAKQEFYTAVMNIKEEADNMIPDGYTSLTNTIKIGKDLIERFKDDKGLIKSFVQNLRDVYLRRADDTEFGTKASVLDFNNKEVQILPVYYTKKRANETEDDMTTDVVSSMIAYTAMACDYRSMLEVADALEIGKDIMENQSYGTEVGKSVGNRIVEQTIRGLGEDVKIRASMRGDKSLLAQKLEDFMSAQVYGKYSKDAGDIVINGKDTGINKRKVVGQVGMLTSISALGLNIAAGLNSMLNNKWQMFIESLGGRYFNLKDVAKAKALYMKYLPILVAQSGDRVKTADNYVGLWNEKFNVQQDHEKNVRHVQFNRKTWFGRLMNWSTAFFCNNMGDHLSNSQLSIALALRYPMLDNKGNTTDLFHSFEGVEEGGERGLGASLQLKKGYRKADGSEFTRADLIDFINLQNELSVQMFGAYNYADRNAFQRTMTGALVMMFRGYLVPQLYKRYHLSTYNLNLKDYTEGYYNTFGRFMWSMVKDIKQGTFHLAQNWGNLSKYEKANVRKATVEFGTIILLGLLFSGAFKPPKEKKKGNVYGWVDNPYGNGKTLEEKKTWFESTLLYQSRRLYTEIAAFTPTPAFFKESAKLLKEPMASLSTADDIINMMKLLFPTEYMSYVQSGRYKGHTKAYKDVMESPFIPFYRNLYKWYHPEDMVSYYQW